MGTSSRVDQLLELTELTWVAASFAVFFLLAVASTERRIQGRYTAEVQQTDALFGFWLRAFGVKLRRELQRLPNVRR